MKTIKTSLSVVLLFTSLAITTLSTTTITIQTAYAGEVHEDIDVFGDNIKAKNDDGRQAIADTNCHQGPISGFFDGDINSAQDCDALAANRDNIITEDSGEEPTEPETCEECFAAHTTDEQLQNFLVIFIGGTTLQGACEAFEGIAQNLITIRNLLEQSGVGDEEIDALIDCLIAVGINFG